MKEESNRGSPGRDFVRAIIADDVESGKHGKRVVTRFPPEPNGFLHIGHAKSICLNFGVAAEHGGVTHLRFDDTNPETEDELYVRSIQDDVRWLGFDWGKHLYFASDYFEQLYDYAVQLVQSGLAYVDSLGEDEIREYRGTITVPGRESPFRDRSAQENLDLFGRMRAGEFANGDHVLRAKIDMGSPNMLMRDPILYRIRHTDHYRTGGDWCIYPLYDFTHCLSDSIEAITHSLCTLEFENNREIYDWILDNLDLPPPQPRQYEFARLNIEYTVLSKRKLLQLVEDGHVDGWDDPRMPTIAGMRRRGVPPAALRAFCEMIGVAKTENRVDIGKLEYAIRDCLNHRAPRIMAVLRPLKMVIVNFPENLVEELEAPYFPEDIGKEGSRLVPFTRELFIERSDFEETPPQGFRRLVPGEEVRLRYGYIVRCIDVIKDDLGEITEVHCTYDPKTRGGATHDGRTVKGTIHWVSAPHSLSAEIRLYDRLFLVGNPEDVKESDDFTSSLNPESLSFLQDSRVESSIASDAPGTIYQFERTGYFVSDPKDSGPGHLVYNRTVTLRDGWAKKGASAADIPESLAKAMSLNHSVEGSPSTLSETPAVPTRPTDPIIAAIYDELRSKFALSKSTSAILAQDSELLKLYRAGEAYTSEVADLARWVINEVPRVREGRSVAELPFGGRELAELVELVSNQTISGRAAKEVLSVLASVGGSPADVVKERSLGQVSDAVILKPIVARILEANPEKVDAYRKGKKGLLGFFVGQVMTETNGAAAPDLTRRLLEEALVEVARD
ncbi:MAG: glutamine--tRNA ligase/YqeY domain fusion protein [Gemmatimonadota bacterium]|nr:glutamine--tRNA ligase/YqeY domain fusion protein [Gemmatimonadota bacterium]